jgi:hypothetical protein
LGGWVWEAKHPEKRGVGMNNLKVNCYSGQTYAERPESFTWEGVKYEIKEIEKEWREPLARHFQVRTKDNKRFKLCYNESQDRWTLTEVRS